MNYMVAYHWLPDYITSDRGPQFVSHMWTKLCELTGVKRRLSSGYHPETNGSTERMNATVAAYLRAFCNSEPIELEEQLRHGQDCNHS
jgi:transposase InsO family protein